MINSTKRLQNGIKLLDAVYELTLACIENDVYLLPEEVVEIMQNKSLPQGENQDTRKYINNFSTENYNITQKTPGDSYSNYLNNVGMSYKQLIATCFKLNEQDFEVKIENNSVFITPNGNNCDDFLSKHHRKISTKLTGANIKFEKNKILAMEKRDLLLNSNAQLIKPEVKEYKKEQFIV